MNVRPAVDVALDSFFFRRGASRWSCNKASPYCFSAGANVVTHKGNHRCHSILSDSSATGPTRHGTISQRCVSALKRNCELFSRTQPGFDPGAPDFPFLYH